MQTITPLFSNVDLNLGHILEFGNLSVLRPKESISSRVVPELLGAFYQLTLPIKGSARFVIEGQEYFASPSDALILNATQQFHFTPSPDYDQILVRIPRAKVESCFDAIAEIVRHTSSHEKIKFVSPLPINGLGWRAIEPTLHILAKCLQSDVVLLPSCFYSRLEDMLISTLLLHQPNSRRAALIPQSMRHNKPFYIRRAEVYMEGLLTEPVTVTAVATASGVSVRTLQSGFAKIYGRGPLQWLRERRLYAVKEELARNDSILTVTEAATNFGFNHLGEFSKAYKRLFGETAGQTINRTR